MELLRTLKLLSDLLKPQKKHLDFFAVDNEVLNHGNSLGESFKTRSEIKAWLKAHLIKKYTINADLSVDVLGDVDLSHHNLKNIPVKFNHVSGKFTCQHNDLVSLEWAPKSVEGSFNCAHNLLTSLQGAPLKVGSFSCFSNQLTSLQGAPEVIRGGFYCQRNKLTSLEGGPSIVLGEFGCEFNNIQTLEFLPGIITGSVNFYGNTGIGRSHECTNFDVLRAEHLSIQTARREKAELECVMNPSLESTMKFKL